MRSAALVYYITAHGYGHGVRSCHILREFIRICPEVPVVVVSDLPLSFLRNRLGDARVEVRPGTFDVGMVQLDSIRVDVEATLRRLRCLHSVRTDLVRRESQFLRDVGAAGVVADIPALPLEAARAAGVPAIAVGNFGWDWIYREFAERDPSWLETVEAFEEGYRGADLLIRLPFSEDMSVFRRRVDVPVLASPGKERRRELTAMTGAREDRPWTLLSFTSLSWDESALDRVASLDDREFFTVLPLEWSRPNIHAVDREVVPFWDVVASVDSVLSKPGFGIVSDCVANAKPLVYADRGDFREYPILVKAIRRYVRSAHIPADELYDGNLRGWLELAESAPAPPEAIGTGGAAAAVRHIRETLYENGPATLQ